MAARRGSRRHSAPFTGRCPKWRLKPPPPRAKKEPPLASGRGGFPPPALRAVPALVPRPFSRHFAAVRGGSGRCGSPPRSPPRPPPRPLRGSRSGSRRLLLPCASDLRTRRKSGVVRAANGGPSAPPGRYAPTVLVDRCCLRRPPSGVGPVRGPAASRGDPPLSASADGAASGRAAPAASGRVVGRGPGRGPVGRVCRPPGPRWGCVSVLRWKIRGASRVVCPPYLPPPSFPPRGKRGRGASGSPLRRGRGLPAFSQRDFHRFPPPEAAKKSATTPIAAQKILSCPAKSRRSLPRAI